MQRHVHDRRKRRNTVLVGIHDGGHDHDVGDLADFRRLDHNRNTGDIQPASVTGVVIRAEGNQQQKQYAVECHQPAAPLGHGIDIDGGYQCVSYDTQQRCCQLNDDVFQVAVTEFFGAGGAGDGHAAESGCDQAQQKQDHIALLGEITQLLKKLAHSIASF